MRIAAFTPLLAVMASPIPALTFPGCGVCTLIGYDTGLTVQVAVPAEPATYRIEIAAENEALSMSFLLSEPDYEPLIVGPHWLAGERIQLANGLGGPILEDTLDVVVARRNDPRGPREASVRVFRDEALVAERTFQPRYEVDEPNGPGCGKRFTAFASLTVP